MSKKFVGLRIKIFLKGLRIKRSKSPVIIDEAFENTATSKNLLSFESLQIDISSLVLQNLRRFLISVINSILSFNEIYPSLGEEK